MGLLDRRVYPFNDPDGTAVLDALTSLYARRETVEVLVAEIGFRPADFDLGGAMVDVWPRVLEGVSARRKLRALVECVHAKPGSAAYDVFGRLLAEPRPRNALEPYDRVLIGSGHRRAFIDREDLRKHLRELVKDEGARVLVITGEGNPGKTYSTYLIGELEDRIGSFTAYTIDFSEWPGQPLGPVGVMTQVARLFNWSEPALDRSEPEPDLAFTIMTWFRGRIADLARPTWLIFDGLDKGKVTDSGMLLIKQLASEAERLASRRLRVVLIGFTGVLLPATEPYALHETITCIGVDQMKAFFERVAEAVGESLAEDAIEVLLQDFVDPGPQPRLKPIEDISGRVGPFALQHFPLAGAGDG
ncbi:MAG: hypothetical protein ACRDVZ_07740 [Jiangellaceae bacterium]